MASLQGVLQQLRAEHQRAASQLTRLEQAISAIEHIVGRNNSVSAGRRTMSPAARRRIAQAQRARWARARANGSAPQTGRTRRSLSPAARRRIAAAQKRRWAKFRALKKG